MKRVCIIGSGAAGNLLLLNLEKAGIAADRVSIIDPHHDGGDLARKWSSVRSNTIWKQVLDACPPTGPLEEPWASLDQEKPCELHFIASYLQNLVSRYACERHTGTVDTLQQDTEGLWTIRLRDKKASVIQAEIVLVTTGSEPKSIDVPFPSIPLHLALDKVLLSRYFSRDVKTKIKTVAVFGTAHSGTLIVKNLLDIYPNLNIVNFYVGEKPFLFARDGEYNGVKQDAADIADALLAGQYPSVKLVNIQDTAAVLRSSKYIDLAIYSIGFEQRATFGLDKYDGKTGRLSGVTNAWGFGIAYPSLSEDEKNWDVSVPSFQAHIVKQMPSILEALGST